MRFSKMWYVQPTVKLLTQQHLEFLSLTGGSTGSSESIHLKMPHCWKSHVEAHICFYQLPLILTHCCVLPDKRCLSHGMLPLSGHDDFALFE